MSEKNKKLIVIDGNAIVHRSFHALPPLTTKKGELVNAVYGFASTLLSVIEKFRPDYIIATFDLKAPTFRHQEYAEYKATRVKEPDELYAQIERVKELVRAFNIPIYEKEGYEADDVIGTITRQVAGISKNQITNSKSSSKSKVQSDVIETIIVTGDLDTLQLVNDKTKVYALRRGITDTVLYGEDEVMERFGLRPDQMIDYKGLRGDASDNIPGVKGIGEKTATELLKKYQTLEKVYENISEIKGAVKDKLEKDKAQAFKSKWLATIVLDAPVQLDLEKAVTREFDRATIVKLFQELNFFSLIKRLPGQEGIKGSTSDTLLETSRLNLGGVEGVKDFKFELVSSEKLDEFIKTLSGAEEIAIALKTVGEKYFSSTIKGVAVCYKTGRAGYVEYSENNFAKLKTVFENEKIKKIGYDLKYDLEVLRKYNIELQNIDWDVMISAYVLNPGSKTDLANIVLEELGEELETNNKKGQLGLEIESQEEIAQKACRKADYIFKLKSIHEKKIKDISAEQKSSTSLSFGPLSLSKERGNLEDVFDEIEMPLVKILAEMEIAGIHLNKIIFSGISEKITKRIENLEKSIYELAGIKFNINSPKQVAEVLFESLKISTDNIKKLKTGFSTASAELTKLRGEHKIIEKIEEYREIFKLKTTYLDSLPTMTDENSRIHTTFNQAVTATGRLSSSEPNLQNIPIRTDLGQLLRVAFEAEKGYRLVSADYSQIDLRVVAHVSGDKNMIEAFTKGEDIHRATAAIINKVTISQVTEKMRSKAKALNFGIIYGMGTFGFAASAGIDREEAKDFINKYMEKFSGVAKYIRDTKDFAKKNLFVETQLGRRRYIPEINSANFQVQSGAERMAVNMPIQGMAADIMKLAMIAVAANYESNTNVRMLLQVHDEIILEVREDFAAEVSKKVKEIMENVIKLKVPLVVDVKMGDNWGEI